MDKLNELTPKFTQWKKGENWVQGTIGKYTFSSKLFDEGSTFGIDNGRVSKLSIHDESVRQKKQNFFVSCIVNYDRGWDIRPTNEYMGVFKSVMDFLENAPKDRFIK